MKPLVLTLRQRPDQRLDLSALVPNRLTGKSVGEIERLDLSTSRHRVHVGELFRVRAGSCEQVRLEDACDRLDLVGHGMTSGELVVEGNVGAKAGRRMNGGRLTIRGDAGPWAASGMQGGYLEIAGNAGDRLGGPLAGEVAGMRGGVVCVTGDAGERAGDRMRRGTIIVQGGAGPYAGSRMLAGTLIVRHATGALPGYLMRRGTIVCGAPETELSPTFVDCGIHHLIAMRLLAAFVRSYNKQVASILDRPLRRFAGDMAALGKGEIFCST
ncbi:MAG: formylmethanofuran dehydrogenase subunit C [Xanthobacteraceae bacterium]|nr:formylmethanofuran dehydrogenase subunit C [Xanthobacteraceae bacterium]